MKFAPLIFLIHEAYSIDTWAGGPTFTVSSDKAAKKLKITASVPSNMYLGLAYGSNMSQTDMVQFAGTGGSGTVKDLWGVGNATPETDSSNSYSPTTGTLANGKYSFSTSRSFDTQDAKDKKLECGKTYNFKWVGSSSTASMQKHNKSGSWTMKIDADCGIGSSTGAVALAAAASGIVGLAVEMFI